MPRVLILSLTFVVGTASVADAQTLDQLAASTSSCTTAGVEALSRQLADYQGCLNPGQFVRFDDISGVMMSSTRVHPYVQASARSAIAAAVAAHGSLTINSAFRTVADQYLLKHSGGCSVVAEVGRSNHQSGRAIDVQNWSAARSALTNAGCAWFGSSDAVHFDCPGSDQRDRSVLAFQALWNLNHPDDMIEEDGLYGPNTARRLGQAPVNGFANASCDTRPETCTPGCDGDVAVAADCTRTTCVSGSACESGMCVATEPEPEPGPEPDPTNPSNPVGPGACAGIQLGRVCVYDNQIGTCENERVISIEVCAGLCEGAAPLAACGDPLPLDGGGLGSLDGGVSSEPVTRSPSRLTGSCAAGGSAPIGTLPLLLALGLLGRRRR